MRRDVPPEWAKARREAGAGGQVWLEVEQDGDTGEEFGIVARFVDDVPLGMELDVFDLLLKLRAHDVESYELVIRNVEHLLERVSLADEGVEA